MAKLLKKIRLKPSSPKKRAVAVPKPKNGAAYFNQWLLSKRKQWFTLGDLRKLKSGQTIELLNADRNVGDSIDHAINQKKLKKGVAYDPVELFRKANSIVKYTHDKGASEKILFGYEKAKWQDFTFEPLLRNTTWYPLPATEVMKLPLNTPVGWRGECITLAKAGKKKVVIADNPNEEFVFL